MSKQIFSLVFIWIFKWEKQVKYYMGLQEQFKVFDGSKTNLSWLVKGFNKLEYSGWQPFFRVYWTTRWRLHYQERHMLVYWEIVCILGVTFQRYLKSPFNLKKTKNAITIKINGRIELIPYCIKNKLLLFLRTNILAEVIIKRFIL